MSIGNITTQATDMVEQPAVERREGERCFCRCRCRKRRRRTLYVAVIFVLVAALRLHERGKLLLTMHQYEYYFDFPAIESSQSQGGEELLQECTKEASAWERPPQLLPTKYRALLQTEEVLAYLISRLDEIDAPVTLMYGTMLREYRNGTSGPCLIPDHDDKDFDVAVFPNHFKYVLMLEDEIRRLFNWKFWYSDMTKGRMYVMMKDAAVPYQGGHYQIDVYGFQCKDDDVGHIYFPWDMVTIASDGFLPVKKHKLVKEVVSSFSRNTTTTTNADNRTRTTTVVTTDDRRRRRPGFYMPNDPPCLLSNIYGSDYMTPKKGSSSQAKWGTENGRPAYDNPRCSDSDGHTELTPHERDELEVQMAYCSSVFTT